MRTLQLLTIFIVAPILARADFNFPSYLYFYSCDSGVVDCSTFTVHNNGNFGFIGTVPVEWDPNLGGAVSQITASNIHGDAVGLFQGFDAVNVGISASQGGVVHCLFGPLCIENLFPADINNNGLFITNDPFGEPAIGTISSPSDFSFFPPLPGIGFIGTAYAINDLQQVLVSNQQFGDPNVPPDFVKGVLSPFVVPEPSALLLLATVLIGLGCRRRWRTS